MFSGDSSDSIIYVRFIFQRLDPYKFQETSLDWKSRNWENGFFRKVNIVSSSRDTKQKKLLIE